MIWSALRISPTREAPELRLNCRSGLVHMFAELKYGVHFIVSSPGIHDDKPMLDAERIEARHHIKGDVECYC